MRRAAPNGIAAARWSAAAGRIWIDFNERYFKVNYKVISMRTTGNPKVGKLSFLEEGRDIDFPIKRIYYISGVPAGLERGHHAHKRLHQLLFCPYGEILITLDDGFSKEQVLLDEPSKGLVVGPGCWRTMLWKTEGAVLCVAASEYYDETDYIRSYDEFKAYIMRNT